MTDALLALQTAPFLLLAFLVATVCMIQVALPGAAATANFSRLTAEHHDGKELGYDVLRGRQLQTACPAVGVLPGQIVKKSSHTAWPWVLAVLLHEAQPVFQIRKFLFP
jgi:hypothetical protein